MGMREEWFPSSWQEVIEFACALWFVDFQSQQYGTNLERPERPKHVPRGMRSHDFDCKDARTGRVMALEIARLFDSEGQEETKQFFLELLRHLKRTLDGRLPGDFSIQVQSPIELRAQERQTVWKNLPEVILGEARKLEVGSRARVDTSVPCLLHRLTKHGSRLAGIWLIVQSADDTRQQARAFFELLVTDKNSQLRLARSKGQETFLLLHKISQTYDVQFVQTLLDEMQSDLYSNTDHFLLLNIESIEEIIPSFALHGEVA